MYETQVIFKAFCRAFIIVLLLNIASRGLCDHLKLHKDAVEPWNIFNMLIYNNLYRHNHNKFRNTLLKSSHSELLSSG